MKNLLFSLALFFSLSVYGQWIELNSGTSEDLYDVYAVNENIALVVGSNGTILKTTDGGETWMPQNSGTTVDLRRIYFVNENIGFAVGFNGTLLKTIDTGANWEMIATETNEDLFGLSVINENLVFVSGANGVLKKTTNGGGIWIDIDTPNNDYITDIQFFGEDVGYIKTGNLYDINKLVKTENGGSNWVEKCNALSAFHFINENVGFTTCYGISRTIDGGDNLVALGTVDDYISDVFSTNENIIWGVSNTSAIGYPTIIFKGEMNSNNQIDLVTNPTYNLYESVFFFSQNIGYAVGQSGIIAKNYTGNMLNLGEANTPEKNYIKITPNPAKYSFKIELPNYNETGYFVKIVNAAGQLFFFGQFLNQKEVNINVEHLATGEYFLQATSAKHHYTKKLIVK